MRWLIIAFAGVFSAPLPAPAHAAPDDLQPPTLSSDAPAPPWFRRRLAPKSHRPTGQGLVDLKTWPEEPARPAGPIDPARFGDALRATCGHLSGKRKRLYTQWILESAKTFDVDPFLIAGVIHDRGACHPKTALDGGVGLSGLQVATHAGHFRKRRYTYYVLDDGRWTKRTLHMPEHPFYGRSLELARPSIYFTAGLLRVFREQCPDIDGAFGSVPHRHHVSHFVWGDRVWGADDEDRVLISRRRMIRAYQGTPEPVGGKWRDLKLRLPLDGAPRKLSSVWGEPRAGGARQHQGVDFASPRGEPIRAIADGKIFFAGADLKTSGTRNMPYSEARDIKYRDFGNAGMFVKMQHPGGLVSVYMHLDSYDVVVGQSVVQGELIGTVGRSGIKDSLAHLHFELRHDGKRIDPLPHLGDQVIPPEATWRGRRLAWERKRLRRRGKRPTK